jgi:hypothetical protein
MRGLAHKGLKASVGPHDSLIWQPIVCLMGQCELIAQILLCIKWAHARTCTQGPRGLCGPIRQSCVTAHCMFDGPMRANCPNTTAIPLAANYAGPCDSLMQQPFVCLMGQYDLIDQILWCMKWAHARTCTRGAQGLCGPTQAHQQGLCGPTSAAIPLAANYVGPCDSLVRQPFVCLMGQYNLIAQILWHMKWAHVRTCTQGPQHLFVGPY